MAKTYTVIATFTATTSVANIEFTSIPADYTDLAMLYSLRTSAPAVYNDISVTLNSTNSSSGRVLYTIGSSPNTYSPTAAQGFFAEANGTTMATTFSNGSLYIPNYLSANAKSLSGDAVVENNSAGDNLLALSIGFYSGVTSAVTSIKLTPADSRTFAQYSSATLYGIKNS